MSIYTAVAAAERVSKLPTWILVAQQYKFTQHAHRWTSNCFIHVKRIFNGRISFLSDYHRAHTLYAAAAAAAARTKSPLFKNKRKKTERNFNWQ